jgi:hypothetical protein
MNVLITLTAAGTDTGPFSLYSNVDSYAVPFQTGVAKSALVAGLMVTTVPNAATIVRVKSVGTCTTSVDLSISGIPPATTTSTTTWNGSPTTTTTTSTSSSTTSTTSTSTSTTSTTTTGVPINHPYSFLITIGYSDAAGACASNFGSITVWGDDGNFLANVRYYTAQNTNTYFAGSGLYYNYPTNGQYVRISNLGINLDSGTCA